MIADADARLNQGVSARTNWKKHSTALSREQVLEVPHLLIGTADQICEGLWVRREHFGVSYIAVFEQSMEAFAPVVSRLAGK